MSEFEDRLRSEVTRRAQEFSPSADLPERIHTQVRRRRRQRQVSVGAASGGALAAAVTAAVLLIRPVDNAIETTDPGPPRTTESTGAIGTTEPSETTDPSDTTGPSDTTEPTGSPDTTQPPEQTTETTEPTETTETTESTTTDTTEPEGGPLKPPDSEEPTVGVCTPAGEIVLGPEGPAPPCARVTADQRLQVRNDTDQQVTVTVGGWVTDTLEPGESGVIGGRFGGYLQPGVHRVTVSPYDPAGPEIWLAP